MSWFLIRLIRPCHLKILDKTLSLRVVARPQSNKVANKHFNSSEAIRVKPQFVLRIFAEKELILKTCNNKNALHCYFKKQGSNSHY